MSVAHIEKFYQHVQQNPALLEKLVDGAQTPEEFIQRAVKEAQSQGLSITEAEATEWINSQIKARQDGELSDMQLEAVAGGKGGGQIAGQVIGGVAGAFLGRSGGAASTGMKLGGAVGGQLDKWFGNW